MTVSTTAIQASPTAWTDCGAGPFVNASSTGVNCLFAIADTIPAVPSPGFYINPEFPWSNTTTSHLWVTGIGIAVVSK
jgi:hypothetical protein